MAVLPASKTKPNDFHNARSSAVGDVGAGKIGAGINPAARAAELDAVVFIKGDNTVHSDFNGQSGIDPFRQTYSITNSGPTYRRGRNLYILRPAAPDGKLTQLTHFKDGYVSKLDVCWDGRRVIFAYRADGDRCGSTGDQRPAINHCFVFLGSHGLIVLSGGRNWQAAIA